MNPWPVEAEVEEVHLPRPGHADLVGVQKYGHSRHPQRARARQRPRDGGAGGGRLGRPRVPHRARRQRPQPRGPDRLGAGARARSTSPRPTSRRVDDDPVRCLDAEARARRWSRRSTGCARPTRASAAASRCAPSASCPGSARTSPGRTGSTAGWRRRSPRSSRSRAWRSARPGTSPGRPGSEAHDEIFWSEERGYYRETNHAGGLEGGMTQRPAAAGAGGDQADLHPDQAAALGRHRDQASRPRRCASAPTRPSCPPPRSSARRWSA